MNAWLYPVSRDGRHAFRDAAGKRRSSSPDGVREAIVAGTFPVPAAWTCVQNGAHVAPGDALYLYSGGTGIFAAGVVAGAKRSTRTTDAGTPLWLIEWELDEQRTVRLLEKPVPADEVRKHVHPRVTVRNFSAGARALRRRLA